MELPLYWLGLALFLAAGNQAAPAPFGMLAEADRTVPYRPREGDLVFFDDKSPFWTPLFALAGTGPPLHMGIVVKRSSGAWAVLEAGPNDTIWVDLIDLGPRLRQFHRDYRGGTIHIRQVKQRLSPEKSAALTKFAEAQNGKRYAVVRLLLQGTPWRIRGTSLEKKLARTDLDRSAWICSELAVTAGTVAGLIDPQQVRANITYPRDVVDNRRHDLSADYTEARLWQPARPLTTTGRGR